MSLFNNRLWWCFDRNDTHIKAGEAFIGPYCGKLLMAMEDVTVFYQPPVAVYRLKVT